MYAPVMAANDTSVGRGQYEHYEKSFTIVIQLVSCG